jgi:plasmid maintenance system antidote protein VapI
MAKKLDPIHPGEVLLTDFLEPLDVSQYRLARFLDRRRPDEAEALRS